MKYLTFILALVLSVGVILGLTQNNKVQYTSIDTSNFLRIHIRANSNELDEQQVKYKIKDEFVNFLTPKVCECNSKDEVIKMVDSEKTNLERLADGILKENGFDYVSNVKICKEYFPTRSYDEYVLESGIYDSIIVELGSATGNNWWCVIYPPLCFTDFSSNSQNIVYKSKIMEIINMFFKKEN